MNEMLGNQYYIARRYKEAVERYEKALLINPANDLIKKKLIICYLQINELRMALSIFSNLISENINILLNSNHERDDCPCRQMIYELENYPSKFSETEKSLALGILWFYCDISTSQKYFNEVIRLEPDNSLFKNISQKINNSFSQHYKESQNGKERHFS